ncbi:hypothetical protein [Gemmata sp.]|uniref:hypothetical protein n=1 Tax=Gemmata sp. TaxID=1914242 RepID=UPI003F71E3B3
MTRTALALSTLVWAAANSLAADAYAPRDGRFSVRFPGAPKETTAATATPLGDAKVFTATYATADGDAYSASYSDYPAGKAAAEPRGKLYDGARDALKGADGKVLAEKDVEVGPDKLPGRDLDIQKGTERVRVRLVLRGDRLHHVAVVGSPAFVTGRDAAKFLDSFELTK